MVNIRNLLMLKTWLYGKNDAIKQEDSLVKQFQIVFRYILRLKIARLRYEKL
jgi:hypothetical protein